MPCKKCGECCKYLVYIPKTSKMREWLIARGGSPRTVSFAYEDGSRESVEFVLIPSRCPNQNEDNTCRIHDTDKYPALCREYIGQWDGGFFVPPECGMACDPSPKQ